MSGIEPAETRTSAGPPPANAGAFFVVPITSRSAQWVAWADNRTTQVFAVVVLPSTTVNRPPLTWAIDGEGVWRQCTTQASFVRDPTLDSGRMVQ